MIFFINAEATLSTYGEAFLSKLTCRDWFQRFKSGDFDVQDRHGCEKEKILEDFELEALLAENSCQTGIGIERNFSRTLKEKRSQYQERHNKVILQHDNDRSHVARPVKTYLETLKWDVLPTGVMPHVKNWKQIFSTRLFMDKDPLGKDATTPGPNTD